jgi:hypothetical protein
MTTRECILATIRGEVPERLPWVPRLEFWHRVHRGNGTMPPGLESLDMLEVADKLGAGRYSVVPDYTTWETDADSIDGALGFYNLPVFLHRTTLQDVERRVISRGRETIVEYHTPVGSIRTASIWTDEMLAAGASAPWTTGHPIKDPKDFEVVGYIYSHAKVEPQLKGYLERRERVGDRGLVIGPALGPACPIHHIMRVLMTTEQFYYALNDYPEQVERLAAQIEPLYQRIRQFALESPAEVLLAGTNFDDSITPPRFFEKYLLPPLRAFADQLHARGKFLLSHTDGENRKLSPYYRKAGIDVGDSICPAPMTSCTLDEMFEAFAGQITIWGGIPSVLLCKSSATWDQFREYVDDVIERHGRRPRFVLGVSDMVTADAEWDRLCYISEKVAAMAN